MTARSLHRQTLAGWGFLLPNILGFVSFVMIPLVASLFMAFTNWDLRHHNLFKHEPLGFVGFDNFRRLLSEPAFWTYLRNTLVLMAGIPFSIAGSLMLALMLSRELGPRRDRGRAMLVLLAIIGLAALCLMAGGARGTALMLGVVWAGVLIAGVLGGSYTYRTLLFIPAFTNGVAVFLLWKKLYNPTGGPINAALSILLGAVQSSVRAVPPMMMSVVGVAVILLAVLGLTFVLLRKLVIAVRDQDLTAVPAALCAFLVGLPMLTDHAALSGWPAWIYYPLTLLMIAASLWFIYRSSSKASTLPREPVTGFVLMSLTVALAEGVLLLLAGVCRTLPAMAAAGLSPPNWLSSYQWAKPALIVVGFWASVGSGNMLLYLAALSNVPQELYEAADMDGAPPLARFWNVTFPQLGPTTFFIVIMSMIGGIQGGFEIARAMTNGGPAESTTTLSFFVYRTAFEDGRLGYASAAAWLLCVFVFVVTLINWRVGSRYVND